MNILKKTYAKLIDKITIDEAPVALNGIVGFNNSADLCNSEGYKEVQFASSGTGWSIYEDTGEIIIESFFDYDKEAYENQVKDMILAHYSYDQQLAIQRKKLAGIDESAFDIFNDFCENCKKTVKLKMIG